MRITLAILLAALFGTTGCVKTTTQSRLVSDGERPVLVSPKDQQSPLDARVRYEDGLIRGRLGWSKSCRTGIETLSHDEVVEVKSANHGAGVVALLVGGFISVVSAAVLSNASTLSDVETCSSHSDGSTSCSSPQRDATALGMVGIGTGLTFGGIGVATFGVRSTTTTVETVDHPATLSKVSEATVPCGTVKLAGVGVALIRGMERVASSTTNHDGDFALVVPARMTGRVAVFIESVPSHVTMLRPNDQIASIDIPAIAESAAETPNAGAPAADPRPGEFPPKTP